MQWRSWVGLFGLATVWLGGPQPAAAAKKLRVALLSDVASASEPGERQAAAIREVASGDSGVDVEIPANLIRSADGTSAGVRRAYDELLGDKGVDLVVLLGPIGSYEAVHRSAGAKPVVAARVLDPRLFGAPSSGPGSGVKNLTYVADPLALAHDLAAIKELGGVGRLAILVDKGLLDAIPGLADGLRARAKEAGLEATVAPALVASAPAAADVAYLYGSEALDEKLRSELIRSLHGRKMRTFSSRGAADVSLGAVAGLTAPDDAKQRGRRVAIDVLRISGNESTAEIPTSYQRAESLFLNVRAAQELGWSPPFLLLADAELIGAVSESAEASLSLEQAVKEALKNNQDFEANRFEIESGSEEVSLAVANFLPKIELQARGVVIDADRAAASFGTQPQRTFSGVVTAKGALFAEKAFANHTIQSHIQDARVAGRSTVELDLALETAKSYLLALQTRVLESVRLDNARKTRANLNQAKLRASVGSAGPMEVLRWESQLAIDRQEVLKARALRRLAETQLNRLLHRPLEQPLAPAKEAEDQALMLLAADRLSKVIESEQSFAAFRNFLVEEGIKTAPEMKALDAAVEASERAVATAWRSFYVPTLGYQAELAYRFLKAGPGKDPPSLPDGLSAEQQFVFGGIIPPPVGNFTWSIAGVVSLPLPFDTAAFSDLDKAEAERSRRETERTAAREKIEQRIRSAAYQVGASHPSVALATSSAESAKKALAIAQDAYGTGAIGVLDLLDAQNLALVAELLSVGARYTFMADELTLERSVGTLLFLKSKEERDDWLRRSIESVNRP